MGESVIFNSPLLLILYGIALALAIFEVVTKATGYVLPLIGIAIVVGTSIYALLIGATLFEVAIVLMVFLLISLVGLRRKKG